MITRKSVPRRKTGTGTAIVGSAPQKICIVTPWLMANVSHFETQASIAGLAQLFASLGSLVTVLWVPWQSEIESLGKDDLERAKRELFESFLIDLQVLPPSPDIPRSWEAREKMSAETYHYLRERSFDAVYFVIDQGLAYFPLLARETGVGSELPSIRVLVVSPIHWRQEFDKHFPADSQEMAVAHMERYCAEAADQLICFSDSMLAWMKAKGWKIAPGAKVILPPRPFDWRSREPEPDRHSSVKISELAFVGSPEFREGLLLFCNALDLLAEHGSHDLTVTVLGRFGKLLGEHAGGMMLRRARNWPFKLKLFPRMQPSEIVSYLKRRGCLVIFPAAATAVPLWGATCLAEGIPFLAASEGVSALVAKQSRARHVCRRDQQTLANAISAILDKKAKPAVASEHFLSARQAWQTDIAEAMAFRARKVKPDARILTRGPLVSIVLVHYDRPRLLREAIEAVRRQEYKNIELVLVDDGSKLEESRRLLDSLAREFARRRWRIIRTKNRYLGAARNTGIAAARGRYILFADDDNQLFTKAVGTLVRAMERSGADICTCFARFHSDEVAPRQETAGQIHYFPLGDCLPRGFVANDFGDANAMVKRTVFKKAGYFKELSRGQGGEDWEFFARAVLAGMKLRVVPEALYWYRMSPGGMHRQSHWHDTQMMIIETYAKHGFAGLSDLHRAAIATISNSTSANMFRENLSFSPENQRLLRLSDLDPNSDAAIEGLAAAAAAEGRSETALTLVGALGGHGFAARAVATLAGERDWEKALARAGTGFVIDSNLKVADLTDCRVAAVPEETTALRSHFEEPDRLYLESRSGGMTVAALPAACPSGTVGVTMVVAPGEATPVPMEFLALVAPLDKDSFAAAREAMAERRPGSSGWTLMTEDQPTLQLDLSLEVPLTTPHNLVLAARLPHWSKAKSAFGRFSGITLHRMAGENAHSRPRMRAPREEQRARDWTQEEISRAKLVTAHNSVLPMIVAAPGQGLMLRPSKEGPTVAALDSTFPAFARRVAAEVEIAHEEASPFEFALALHRPEVSPEWRGGAPNNCEAFSGWRRVSERFRLHDIGLTAERTSRFPLTISLAVRVPKGSAASPANAFWRRLRFFWEP